MFSEDTDNMYLLLSLEMNAVSKPCLISTLFFNCLLPYDWVGFCIGIVFFSFFSSSHRLLFLSTLKLHFILFTNSHLVAIVLNPGTLTRKTIWNMFCLCTFQTEPRPNQRLCYYWMKHANLCCWILNLPKIKHFHITIFSVYNWDIDLSRLLNHLSIPCNEWFCPPTNKQTNTFLVFL